MLTDDVSGPGAPVEATAAALARADSARAVVLVEGISDQMALETLAGRQERDLGAEGVVIVPIGGAHAAARYLARFGPEGAGVTVAGMCDAAELHCFRRGLAAAGFGSSRDRTELERWGFFVCDEDLEDELIRTLGVSAVERVIESEGEIRSLRALQKQPAQRERSVDLQVRRFLGSGSGRKIRYARLLVEALHDDDVPRPLDRLLEHVLSG